LLQVASISKAFAGVQALGHSRSFRSKLRPGEVHAAVAKTGGKSTLIKLITGDTSARLPEFLTIQCPSVITGTMTPVLAKRLGIACIYQQPALFPDLTVSENLAINLERGGPWRIINWKQRREQSQRLLQRVGAKISPDATVNQLTMPSQQLVEIAGALGANARILIMDERRVPGRSGSREFTQCIRELRARAWASSISRTVWKSFWHCRSRHRVA